MRLLLVPSVLLTRTDVYVVYRLFKWKVETAKPNQTKKKNGKEMNRCQKVEKEIQKEPKKTMSVFCAIEADWGEQQLKNKLKQKNERERESCWR